MPKINPYLNFKGNTEEAFNFYKSVFGGEFATVMRWKDMPGAENTPADASEKIMHIALPIGDEILMASDTVEGFGPPLTEGNNFNICVSPDSKEEADRLFKALSPGGEVIMPMADAFWGDYFGMVKDRFGVHWMIDYGQPREK